LARTRTTRKVKATTRVRRKKAADKPELLASFMAAAELANAQLGINRDVALRQFAVHVVATTKVAHSAADIVKDAAEIERYLRDGSQQAAPAASGGADVVSITRRVRRSK
jgi:hypothetical protein